MPVSQEAIDELTEIEQEMIRAGQSVRTTQAVLHEQQQHMVAMERKFQDKLKYATDGKNAVVLGDRAYWMSAGTLCHINLQKPEA